jgi:hypothetical protein
VFYWGKKASVHRTYCQARAAARRIIERRHRDARSGLWAPPVLHWSAVEPTRDYFITIRRGFRGRGGTLCTLSGRV